MYFGLSLTIVANLCSELVHVPIFVKGPDSELAPRQRCLKMFALHIFEQLQFLPFHRVDNVFSFFAIGYAFYMSDLIPPCTLAQLRMVYHAKEKNPHFDLRQAVRAALADNASLEEMVSVGARLIALQNMIVANPSLSSRTDASGKARPVHVAVLRAAARAPLETSVLVNELCFDAAAFNAVLKEESYSQT